MQFFAEDIRTAIEKGKEYDLLIWSAAPHLWENDKETVKNLRKCVKHNGYIVIVDAYLYSDALKEIQPDYETLAEITESVTKYGDSIVKCTDYQGTLWAENYQADREAILQAMDNSSDPMEREGLERYLKIVNQSEQSDTACFGLYILVLQVKKP